MRVDAARNRDRIVAAARELIARDGPDVTMDALARRSGVAVGTLYRHFPTKTDLVAAVVEGSVARIAALTEAAVARVDAGAAPAEQLAEAFLAVAADHPLDRAIKQAAASLGVGIDVAGAVNAGAGSSEAAVRATTALAQLLDAAKTDGAVDPALTVDDLAMLLTQLPDTPGRALDRYVDIVLAGIVGPRPR